MNFQSNPNSPYIEKLNLEKKKKRVNMHSFHRYYGKLIPAIPSLFINEFTKKGDLICDPFMGSGTTGIEAIKSGRNFLGLEVNPIAYNIAKVKTSDLNPFILQECNLGIMDVIKNHEFLINESDYPYLLNKDHWFKEFVQHDLLIIHKAIEYYFNNVFEYDSVDNIDDYKNFYYITESAIIRNVSNADTQHVFPGVSKRMRALEAEGKIHIDTIASFERAIKKRALYYQEYKPLGKARLFLTDSTTFSTKGFEGKVDLIVTNPPYISSVRYIETLKLEMYWMEYITDSNDYSKLAHLMLGNDRLSKSEYETINHIGIEEIDSIIDKMILIDKKSAKILETFFSQMDAVIKKMSILLKKGGRVVIKISDSKIKRTKIETGKLMTTIAQKYNFELVDVFTDEINSNSRSLTLARNTYSDIITHDYIVIWEKK